MKTKLHIFLIFFFISHLHEAQCDIFSVDTITIYGCSGGGLLSPFQSLSSFNSDVVHFYGPHEIPEGTGDNYTSELIISLPDTMYIESEMDIVLCVSMEHSYLGDLEMMLTSPNGQNVNIFNAYTGNGLFPGGFGGGGTFLGGANDAVYGVIGVCETYCFSHQDEAMPSWNFGYNTVPTSYPASCPFGNCQMLEPGNYNPEQSFATFIGSSINGIWTLRVKDNLSIDDGFVCSWSLQYRTKAPLGNWNTSENVIDSTDLFTLFSLNESMLYHYVAFDSVQNCYDTLWLEMLTNPTFDTAYSILGPINVIEHMSVSYSIQYVEHMNYAWQIFGGTIIYGQHDHQVTVQFYPPHYNPAKRAIQVVVHNDCGEMVLKDFLEVTTFINGLEEISSSSSAFTVFPNPATTQVNITSNQLGILNFYSIDGKLIESVVTTELQSVLDISHLIEGIYLIIFAAQDGQIYQAKCIKEQ